MNSAGNTLYLRLERGALWIAAGGAILAGALATIAPKDFGLAYRFALFGCLGPGIGSLIFVLILRMTGGRWGPPLLPFFHAGIALLPWTWILAALALLLPPFAPDAWPAYDSRAMEALRAMVYAAVFFGLRFVISRRPGSGDPPWVGPGGLIGLVFILHFLADDWLAGLEPHWHSTAFPLVWITSQAVAGLSAALLTAFISDNGRPAAERTVNPPAIDWGNLLLATMLLWCYVTFAQLLVIWSGNLPREISWYEHRVHDGWLFVVIALALFHFAVPFVFLLSRRFKQFPAGLAGIAGLLLAAQLTYTAWTILPAGAPAAAALREGIRYGSLAKGALALALLLACGGFFINRYLAAARRFSGA